MSTELTVRSGALALDPTQTEWTARQRAALEQLGLADAPVGDLMVFLHYAQRTGLDPFSRQIYLVGRWDPELGRKRYTIQAAIDGLRTIAEEHGQYGGQIGPEWCGPDGRWCDVWLDRHPPVAARVGIVRKDWAVPIYGTAHFLEFAEYRSDGALKRIWREKATHMVAKCAEALALRRAFPRRLAGIYTPEEMARADSVAADHHRQVHPPTGRHADQAEAERIDWDAEIRAADGDPQALRRLWDVARAVDPNNTELANQIAERGQAARAVADRAAEDQEDETPAESDAPAPHTTDPQPENDSDAPE